MAKKKKRSSVVEKSSPPEVRQKKKPEKDSLLIVGIGASAGGLETLELFFRNMPPEPGIAFVVIQHLSPKHKSIMASLLAKHTRMTVREIEDDTPIEPNCVYINPPDKHVVVFNGVLHLLEPIKTGMV
ncbi:MAG: chemotaxis protein CheR, partial [Desulfatitalea sp.]|nr:chemotaxis protein CheR [Desulfatitalea sp.]NNK00827.1 chemotaxis protein CheR [Desulfatitalea sp.]